VRTTASTIATIVRRVVSWRTIERPIYHRLMPVGAPAPWRPCSDHWRDDVKKRAVISLESLAPSATDAITVIARCVDSPPIIVQTVFSTVRAPVLANDVVEHLVIGLKWSRCCGDRSPDRPAPARCVPSATIGVTMWLECSVDRGSGPDRCPRHGGSTGNRLRHGQFCGPLATVPA